jgi:hypothetical protein
MPVHCQKAAAMQASFSIDSAFGFSLSEKSPNKTSQPPDGTLHGSGSLETGLSPSNALLASTAMATFKASASPDCDITNCAVDVNDPDIPGFVDASNGGDLNEQVPQLSPFKRPEALCPPKSRTATFYSNYQQQATYEKAVQLTQVTKREEGGWIYQLRNGTLKAVMKDRDRQREDGEDNDTIVLGKPPTIKGAKVVGTFHVHRGYSGGVDSEPSGYEYEENGYRYSAGDYAINREQEVPGLLLAKAAGGKYETLYGPDRGYMYEGLPVRCR